MKVIEYDIPEVPVIAFIAGLVTILVSVEYSYAAWTSPHIICVVERTSQLDDTRRPYSWDSFVSVGQSRPEKPNLPSISLPCLGTVYMKDQTRHSRLHALHLAQPQYRSDRCNPAPIILQYHRQTL
jgi:hypothetical protein